MKKLRTAILTAGAFLLLRSATAQQPVTPFYPVRSEEEIMAGMFRIPEEDLKYNFTTVLPDGNYLMIGFRRLSDWRPEANLKGMIAIAGHVLEGYRDSLDSRDGTCKLEIHVPVDHTPVISSFSSRSAHTRLVTESGGARSLLKIGMDTVRILKNIVVRPSSEEEMEEEMLVQVQYTFLLKDIRQLLRLSRDTQWISGTAMVYDSLVDARRRKWKRQDAWYHYMYVKYDQNEQDPKKRIQTRTSLRSDEHLYGNRVMNVTCGFGALLVRNDLCPNIDFGLTWNCYSDREATMFTRLSLNSFMRYEEQPDKRFRPYTTSFLNGELGIRSAGSRSRVMPFYQFSIGFGYFIDFNTGRNKDLRDPSISARQYKIFFNYALSKTVIISPEIVGDGREWGKQGSGWMGLGVHFRLF